jgi:hypothetical protein
MNKPLYAFVCTILVTLACGTGSTLPASDPNSIQTIIVGTAQAAAKQTKIASGLTQPATSSNAPLLTDTPTLIPISTHTPASQPKPGGIITQVIMAKDAAPVTAAPINPTTIFTTSSVIHAVAKIKNAPANTKFTASWYVVDDGGADAANTLITTSDLTTGGTRYLDFNLTPTTTWPLGKYRVDILINDQLDQSVNFSVQ